MKIRLIIGLCLFIFVTGAGATDDDKLLKKVKFGATAGINYSNILLSPKNIPHLPSLFLLGWNVWGYSIFNISDKIAVQLELLYTINGNRFFWGQDVYSRRHYIEMPLQMKLDIGKHMYIMGGPYVGYITAVTSNFYEVLNVNTPYSGSDNVPITLNRWDIGATLKVGIEFSNGFNTGIGWSSGLKNINGVASPQQYNEVGTIYVGWTIIKLKNN